MARSGLAENGPGVSKTEIVIGQTMSYSGPLSAVGEIGHAMTAYFDTVNQRGGINGRKIRMLSLDDGFQPPKTVEQVRKLVEEENVLATFGSNGSPTNLATYRYLNQRKVPDLFVISGIDRWNSPKEYPWTVGFVPPYRLEGQVYAHYIVSAVKDPKIAVLYEYDDFGKELLQGLKEGLGDQAAKLIVAEASFDVAEPTVNSQVITLAGSGANVFVDFASSKLASQAIRKVSDVGWNALHILPSPAASVAATLQPAGLDKSVGIISGAFLKDPTDKRWADDAGVKDWLAWMDKALPNSSKNNFFDVLGYSVAQATVQVLTQCGDDLSRENVLKQAQNLKNVSLPMLLPGITLHTSPESYRIIDQMQLQRFNGKEWELFGPIIKG